MNDIECPNCGGAQPVVLGGGMFKCQFCGQQFLNERIRQQELNEQRQNQDFQLHMQRQQMVADQMNNAGNFARRTMWIVGIFIVLVFAFVAYMITKSMNDAQQMQHDIQQDIMKQFQK